MAKLYEVDTSDAPIALAAGKAVLFEVHSLNFVELAATIDAATGAGSIAAATRAQRAARRARQVRALAADGTQITFGEAELLRLPRMLYARLMRDIDRKEEGENPGKVVTPGDGVDVPVVYQLGKPIPINMSADGEATTEAQISELEFVARTGLDIEDVLCEPNDVSKALALIRNCAKPIVTGGADPALQRLPSWALDQITVTDGVTIVEKVLPGFLG
jgi:hypothetical protein